jgi:hypothetical protein
MWGWILAALLLGVLLIPIGVTAGYDELGVRVFLKIGPFRIRLYPAMKTTDKKKAEKRSSKEKTSAEAPKEEAGGKLSDFIPLLRTLFNFLGDLRRRITVKDLQLKLTIAGGDPCDMSIHYGRAWASIGGLLPQLERLFKIKKRNIAVACDYVAEETIVQGYLHISIMLIRLLSLVLCYGVRIIKQYIRIKNNRKGGTGYEPKSSSNA